MSVQNMASWKSGEPYSDAPQARPAAAASARGCLEVPVMEESRCSFSSAGGQSRNRFETHITDISAFDLISKECKRVPVK